MNLSSGVNKHRIVLITVVTFVFCALVALNVKKVSNEPNAIALFEDEAFHFTIDNEYTKKYGPIASQYPWVKSSVVIDLHRECEMKVVEPNLEKFSYQWLINNGEEAEVKDGHSMKHTFTQDGDHEVVLTRTEISSGEIERVSRNVIAKYVRREIRELTDSDREKFFDAMKVLYSLSDKQGIEKYGEHFVTIERLADIHLKYAGSLDCDHFHDGMGFVNHHAALTNMLESSLQIIDPSVTMAYWDYTINGEVVKKVGTTDILQQSIIFDENWFGELWPENGVITKGRWAYTKIHEVDKDEYDVYSPYGLARSPWNLNKNPYLTRYNKMYGAQVNSFPSCSDHYDLMSYTNAFDFVWDSQYPPHGKVHVVAGGSSGFDLYSKLLKLGFDEDVAEDGVKDGFAVHKNMYREGKYSCDSDCSLEDSYTECSCGCPNFDWTDTTTISRLLEPLSLDGTDEQNLAIMKMFCFEEGEEDQYVVLGDMIESGSPIDPLFWPTHPTIERLWLRWRLFDGLDESWPTTGYSLYGDDCSGHSSDDVMDYFFFGGRNDWTNQQLYDFYNPKENNVPYVYHHFIWSHCSYYAPIDFSV